MIGEDATAGVNPGQEAMPITERIRHAEETIREFETQLQFITRRERWTRWDRAIALVLVLTGSLLGFFAVSWGLLVIAIGLWRTICTQDQIQRHRNAAQVFAQLPDGAEQDLALLRASEQAGAA